MKTYLINLSHDASRLGSTNERFADYSFLDIIPIPGVYGDELPHAARVVLTASEFWAPRWEDIGRFLSHTNVWEAVSGETSACLVVEDDAVPISVERLRTLSLPEDADLIFVNSRMSPGGRPGAPEIRPVADALPMLNQTDKGVGSEGYILTPNGARQLLEAVRTDRFFGLLDWRLLRYGVSPEDLAGDLANTRCDTVIRHHHNADLPPKWQAVKAYCLSNPLVRLSSELPFG